ncbi:MAG: cytidine deaminase [Bacteroidota bacterium]|nr:cytidine deaminase [Bacteroidota bacterium]
MKRKNISISYEEYEGREELKESDKSLIKRAEQAMKDAYAPYSNFSVGAALRLEDGTIVIGNNQENSAYPSGLCAERVALFSASSQYPGKKILDAAIIASGSAFVKENPIPPCGACRQVFAEYENKQKYKIRYILASERGRVQIFNGILDLLPFSFFSEHLEK